MRHTGLSFLNIISHRDMLQLFAMCIGHHFRIVMVSVYLLVTLMRGCTYDPMYAYTCTRELKKPHCTPRS